MMQESVGRGTAPMQASECPYNTQYPNTPGAIQDADYSIKVGVQYYADCVREAGCESPQDMDKLKLVYRAIITGMGISHGHSETMEAIARPMRCSFPRNRQPPMGGQVMAIQSMYPMCFGIILAGDCLPDFLEMGSL